MKDAEREEAMYHDTLDGDPIAERFLLGQLSPEEARLFEEHFLGCAECLERVELAERLQSGLKRAAVRRAAMAATVATTAAVAAGGIALRRHLARRLLALALLLAAGLPTALLLPRVLRLDRELVAARAALPPPGKRTEPRGTPVAVPTPTTPPAAEDRRFAAEIAAARREVERLGGELERARGAQVNVPLLALSLVRSGSGEEEPAARLRLPAAAPAAVISLEPSDPGFPVYQATLRAGGGEVRWQGGGLTPAPSGLLTLSLPRALLPPGDYRLEIEGRPVAGPPVDTGTFRFQVVP